MYRLLLPTGTIALLTGVLLYAAQVREVPKKAGPPPAANQQKAVKPLPGAIEDEKAPYRRGAKRVYLGVFTVPVEDMTGSTRKKLKLPNGDGVFVIEVMPDSPAEEAGLKHGDVITHVNGKLVDDEEELIKDLHQVGAGKKVDLTVIRDGKKEEIKAKLGETSARRLGSDAAPNEGEDEVIGMCEQNAQCIERLERRINRLEKRLAELEGSRSIKTRQ